MEKNQTMPAILNSFSTIPSNEEKSPLPLPTPTTPKAGSSRGLYFPAVSPIGTAPDKITLFTKFSNDGVFFAGEKLSCTFTFVPPGYTHFVLPLQHNQQRSPPMPPSMPSTDQISSVAGKQETEAEEEEVVITKASDIQRRLKEEQSLKDEKRANNGQNNTVPGSPTQTQEGGLLSWLWPLIATPELPVNPSLDKVGLSGTPKKVSPYGSTELKDSKSRESSIDNMSKMEEDFMKNLHVGNASIALGFVQLVGYLSCDPSILKLPFEAEDTRRLFGSSGGAGVSLLDIHKFITDLKGIPVLISTPCVLFANLDLNSRNDVLKKRIFEFEAILPSVLPPTHRGRAIRIQYKLILGIQKSIYEKPHFIHLPFRVFGVVHGMGAQTEYISSEPAALGKQDIVSYNVEDERELWFAKKQEKRKTVDLLTLMRHGEDEKAYSSPAMNISKLPDNQRGKSLGNIAELIMKSTKSSYDICKENIHIAHLKLSRNVYRLGEVILASLDFSSTAIRCFQASVYLECIENISPGLITRSKADTERLTKRIISEQHDNCLQLKKLPVSLCIPVSASPEFTTDLAQVEWQIRVEFLIQKDQIPLYKVAALKLGTTHVSTISAIEGDNTSTFSTPTSPTSPVYESNKSILMSSDIQSPIPADSSSLSGFKISRALDSVNVESFDCVIPIHIYPCDWENGRMYPHRQKFVMVNDAQK